MFKQVSFPTAKEGVSLSCVDVHRIHCVHSSGEFLFAQMALSCGRKLCSGKFQNVTTQYSNDVQFHGFVTQV